MEETLFSEQSKARYLSVLAKLMAAKYNVEVVFRDFDTAATDGRTIFMPRFAMVGGANELAMLRGFIDHETAHCIFTGVHPARSWRHPVGGAICNILEDVRIEQLMARRYPGTARNLRGLVGVLMARDFFPAPTSVASMKPVSRLCAWLVSTLRVRYLRNMELEPLSVSCRPYLEQELGTPLLAQVEALADQAVKAPAYSDVQQATEAILDLLLQVEDTNQPNSRDNQGDQGDEGDQGDQGDQGDEGDQGGQGTGRDQATEGEPLRWLDQEQDLPEQDIGAAVRALVNAEMPETAINHRQQLARDFEHMFRPTTGQHDVAQLKQLAKPILSPLAGQLDLLLEARTLDLDYAASAGEVNLRVLDQIVTGAEKVYTRTEHCPGIDTSVMLLHDCSYSMETAFSGRSLTREQVSAATIYTLLVLLSRLDIPVALTSFGSCCVNDLNFGEHFNERAERAITRADLGSTDLAQGLLLAGAALVQTESERKVLLVISDGDPDDDEQALGFADELLAMGLDLRFVYITDSVTSFQAKMRSRLGGAIHRANSPEQVAKAIFGALETVL